MEKYYCGECGEYYYVPQDNCPQCGRGRGYYFEVEEPEQDVVEKLCEKRKKLAYKIGNVWKISEYEEIWFFINNDIIKKNIAYNHHFIAHLVSLYYNYDIKGSFKISIFKTIIITVGSIIESMLADGMWGNPAHRKNKNGKLISQNKNIEESSWFKELIDTAEKYNFFTPEIIGDIRNLKENRDKIHINALKEVEYKYFTKNEVLCSIRLLEEIIIFKHKEYYE